MRAISTFLSLALVGVQSAIAVSVPRAFFSPPPPPHSSPAPTPEPAASLTQTVLFQSQTFYDKGQVAFGLIPSDFRDDTGETMGGFGSAISVQRGTFKQNSDGTYSGFLVVQPDRGYNVITTVNYQGRRHYIEFTLSPYYGTANLSFTAAQQTFTWKYQGTTLYFERQNRRTTGLDALRVRPEVKGYPEVLEADPPLPVDIYDDLSLDDEGLVQNDDGTYWTSDEYGPYIYRFYDNGDLIETIQPPLALLPLVDGTLNFTASTNPDTGRAPNQGFEGLTTSPDGKTLYALLQSATIQDGGSGSNNRYTRFLAYDVSKYPFERGTLIGEWVVPLPTSSKGKNVYAASEVHYLNGHQFLVLARDGDGHGGSSTTSKYKSIDLIDISNATDIHGTVYDGVTPVAPNGVLIDSIQPALYTSFVSLINDTQLGRFGLHNGGDSDAQLIDGKFESIALAPVDDAKYPNDYFLITVVDNDFKTEDGISVGQPYNASINVDTQILVYRVTLPNVASGSVQEAIAN